jgi:hypothetical protein
MGEAARDGHGLARSVEVGTASICVLRVVPNGKVEGLWCYACRLPKLFTSRRNDESDPESKLFGGVPEPLKCLLTG